MISRLHRRRRSPVTELQITAFMNLMVVLVPFLLITAVFTQMTIIDLALPSSSEQDSEQPPPPPGLRVEIRENGLVLLDGERRVERYERGNGTLDTVSLSEALLEIKQRNPENERITLLLEPAVPYEDLVSVMDAVRMQPGSRAAMFPAIAIGDALAENP